MKIILFHFPLDLKCEKEFADLCQPLQIHFKFLVVAKSILTDHCTNNSIGKSTHIHSISKLHIVKFS